MKSYGKKTLLFFLLVCVALSCINFLFTNDLYISIKMLSILLLGVLAVGLPLFKKFGVKGNSFIIRPILNPFAKYTEIEFSIIDRVTIKRDSFGGTTSFKIYTHQHTIEILAVIIKGERKKLADELINKGVLVEYFEF